MRVSGNVGDGAVVVSVDVRSSEDGARRVSVNVAVETECLGRGYYSGE